MKHIFIALVLDILAFTVILPLMPRLMYLYHKQYMAGNDPFYGWCLNLVTSWRHSLSTTTTAPITASNTTTNKPMDVDMVVMGGMIGSLFAALQFLSSPLIGRLSDRIGRKSALLVTMIGNILSAALWVGSRSFPVFLLSRVVGGLSEGNVQLSISMITDSTDREGRARGLALIGVAFAVGFSFGPAIGAWAAGVDLAGWWPGVWFLNEFSMVAALCLSLLAVETAYIWWFVQETSPSVVKSPRSTTTSRVKQRVAGSRGGGGATNANLILTSQFLYLFFFSGAEFTMTFLLFHRFNWSNMQQGRFLAFIGIASSLLQGGWVRRMRGGRERGLVLIGLLAAVVACLGLAVVGTDLDPLASFPAPVSDQLWELGSWTGVLIGLAFALASATVVNSLTALYSFIVDESEAKDSGRDGEMMGRLRSWGQLGRAMGPIVFCSMFWAVGGVASYCIGAIGMALVWAVVYLSPLRSTSGLDVKEKKSK